ncbi:PIN domain-containing protein [Synechococcales cyanobacterium C]|uniref:Ribonuclease VapC n=1 Tax=Petrachloros mirabilis ULC683 TaxID=2781853 RepID=A0A8K1ZZ72_9CYAN|nr:PIN domain-containing protein [Petrachloros mirabilis]NCJ06397.1 PIN domain-containing protein [Petrachloros mirabilis ULC683]
MTIERAFIDTNLFLRYLTNDLPEKADCVEDLLQRAALGEIILVTTSLVIAEIVWTLTSFYGLSREQIRDRVLAILNTPGLEIAEFDLLIEAATNYAAKNVDFIDAYNAAWMVQQQISTAYTFDRKHFSRFENITVKTLGER